jgi:hypothetical protein
MIDGKIMSGQKDEGRITSLRPQVLKFDGVVHQTALGATGKVDVGIIGVDVAATCAAVDAVFTLAGLKAASAEFCVDSHRR